MDSKLWTEAQAIAARHRRGNPVEGEDLAQDLVVAALEEGGAARNPAAWLERVGRNVSIDRWRVESRRAELMPEIQPPAAPPDPETALLARERRGLVRRALSALPRPQRRAALARFVADLSYDQVAERVGAPPITARTRVHRALAILRARLGALRAMFLLPGVQMSALSVVLVAAASPSLAPTQALTVDEMTLAAPAGGRHFARTRVIAPSHAAVAVPKTPVPRLVTAPAPSLDEPPTPQRMVFGDDLVDGNVLGPDGEIVQMMPPVWHPSLIEIRQHFVPELLKSLEDY